jgi:hypothetical protein
VLLLEWLQLRQLKLEFDGTQIDRVLDTQKDPLIIPDQILLCKVVIVMRK